jgi:hypothetical protein
MRTHLIAIAALVATSALPTSAQNPSPNPPQPPQQQQPRPTERQGDTTQRTGANTQAITVTGCLKAEKDVPGRQPNVAERAGVTEDYILTNVKMAQGSPTSGIGLASMYEIEGVSENELQKHLNHQVEIMGSLDTGNQMGNRGAAAGGATSGTATGTSGTGAATGSTARSGNQAGANADLPQLRATSIKMVSATCPAAQ